MILKGTKLHYELESNGGILTDIEKGCWMGGVRIPNNTHKPGHKWRNPRMPKDVAPSRWGVLPRVCDTMKVCPSNEKRCMLCN